MRITQEQVKDLEVAEVLDRDGEVVGGVEQVYLDDSTGEPAWVTVRTGLFGMKETFVPLQDASFDNGHLRVPYDKGYLKDAPNFGADEHLSEQEQDRLYEYYRLDAMGADSTGAAGGRDAEAASARAGGRDAEAASVRAGGDAEAETRMTLHEEQVNVGTERVQTGRVRLRKHVVTEQKTVTVPVQREEYEVVREPVTEGQSAGGADLGEDELEVSVHEERPVIAKDVVATEQVGIQRETVTEQRQVSTDVSHEEVDVVEDTDQRG